MARRGSKPKCVAKGDERGERTAAAQQAREREAPIVPFLRELAEGGDEPTLHFLVRDKEGDD